MLMGLNANTRGKRPEEDGYQSNVALCKSIHILQPSLDIHYVLRCILMEMYVID